MNVRPIQIITLVLGITSVSLSIPAAIQNFHERWVTRAFWKSSREMNQTQLCKNVKSLEGHVPSEEKKQLAIAYMGVVKAQ